MRENTDMQQARMFILGTALAAWLAVGMTPASAIQSAAETESRENGQHIYFWPGESIAVSDEVAAAWHSCNAEGTQQACEDLRTLADEGELIAQFSFQYPVLYYLNTSRSARHAAFTEILRIADAGLPIAQAVAGQRLLRGNSRLTGREPDPTIALQYLRAANEQGSAIAARWLSIAYDQGIEVDVSYE